MKNKYLLLLPILLISFCFVSASFGNSLDDNLAHYFPMNDTYPTITDYVGSGTGTASNSNIVFEQTGKLDKSIYWNTYDSGTNIPMSFPVPQNDWTMAFWVNPDDASQTMGFFNTFDNQGNVGERLYADGGDNGYLKYYMFIGGGDRTCYSTTALNQGEWNLIVVQKGGLGMNLYLNNQLIANNIYTLNGKLNENFVLGGGYQGMPSPQGYMSEVGIWNRALSVEEVGMLWNNSDGLTYFPVVEEEAPVIQGVGNTLDDYDSLVEEEPSITGDVIASEQQQGVGLFALISNFFKNIWTWIRGLFI